MRRLTLPLCALLGALAFLQPAPAAAQDTTGSISGTATDEQQAVLPGVTILVTQVETGTERTQVTDEHGRYRVLGLTPGPYKLTADLASFRTVVRDQLTVAIGKDLLVDIVMQVGGHEETVTVAGETSSVSLGSTTAGGIVTTRQIAELPLNGRSFMQLATLQAGVITSRGTARDFTGGFGSTQLAIGGARPEQTGYLMDGTNIADVSDKAPSSLSGVMLGVDTVQEFSVQTHGYSAEFGRAAGGVMSTVTKSGTNTIRGSLFEFHRDDSLNSRNYFASSGELPPFRRDQFGGTVGGPIVQNKLFYFGSYEQLRERNAVTQHARLPDALAHQGIVPDATGKLVNVGVNPITKPYLDLLYPIPNGVDFGDGTAELVTSTQDPTDEHFGVTKFDYNLGSKDLLMVRWSKDTSKSILSQPHPLFFEHLTTDTRYLTIQDQHLFSSTMINQFRFASNRTARTDDLVPTIDIPQSLYFSTDPHWGAIDIVNVSTAGSIATTPVDYTQDVFQFSDTFTWNKNSHVIKTGFDLQDYHFDGFSYSRYGGTFRFRNVQEFLTLQRTATAQADRFTGNLPGTDTLRDMRQWYMAFFVQDDWRASDSLSLQFGLRYDPVTDPKELNGKIAGLLSLDDLEGNPPNAVTPGTPLFKNPSYKSFAPRLGVAWNPAGDKKSTIKAGYGLFYQPLTTSFYRGTAFRIYPYFAGVDIRTPAVFGPGNIAVLAGGIAPGAVQKRSEFIFYDEKQPYMEQWHVHFDRDLGHSLVAEVGYIGSKGHNLPFYGDPNTTPAEVTADGTKMLVPGATLRYPDWGRIRTRINDARSIYQGATVSLNKRYSSGFQAQVSYTYGNSHDTWSGGQIGGSDFDNGAGSATDWWDPEAEYGPSNYDIHHTLVMNAVWVMPFGQNKTGPLAAVIRGWQLGGVAQFSSGLPFTALESYDQIGDGQSDTGLQKPNINGPVSYPQTAAMWFDPSAFSVPAARVFGNAGRNTLRGPGVKVADLSLFKNMKIGRYTTQVRLEAFNAFNHTNLGLPDATIFNAGGVLNPTAGRITTTSTAARQVQLGLKFGF
jgi:hypothetical protein